MALRLRIASFNLEDLGEHSRGAPALAERAPILRPQLERLKADILCLQEVNAEDVPGGHERVLTGLDRLLEGTLYASYHRVVTMGPGGQHYADKHNLVTLSRWPIAASHQVRHDLVPALPYAPVTAEPRGPTPVELRFDRALLHVAVDWLDGRLVHVVNAHLKAPLAVPIPGQKLAAFKWKSIPAWAEGFYLAGLKRAGQALEARLFVDRLFDQDIGAWIAVCGDFNAEGREVPVRILLGDPDDTGNGALAPRSLSPLDELIPLERRHSVIHAGRRVLLDHILVSPSLLRGFTNVAIFNEDLADEALGFPGQQNPVGSFHAPIVAEFLLPD